MSKAVIHINGVVGEEATLLGVIRQFKSFKKPSEVEVMIDSPGGSVDEGMSIFNYLRGLNLPITTKANRAYSIAASIFMAGDIRLLENGPNRFMIHMPWAQVSGGSKQLEEVGAQLKDIENDFAAFYSKYTSIDEASVKRLLENETFMSAEEAKEIGIATGTYSTLKAVAFYNNESQKVDKTMTKAEKLVKALASFLNGSDETVETPEVVALVLQDSNGEDVEFPELDENGTPEAGNQVMKAGEPVVDGEILMPDGSKIKCVNGVIEEIIPAPEEEPAQEEPEASVEDEQPEASAEEVEETVEDEVDYTALLEDFQTKITENITAQFEDKVKGLQEEIVALKKELGNSIENDPAPQINNTPKAGNFLTNALKKRK